MKRRRGNKRDFFGFFKRVGKGIKKGATKVGKGVKKMAKDVVNFADRAGFKNPVLSKKELREFMRKNKGRTKGGMILQAIGTGATRGFQNLRAPAKAIAMMDPQRNTKSGKLGLSPITLAGAIAMAIPDAVGIIGQSITDKKTRQKIKSGDSDAIMDLAFAPVAFVGGSALSSGAKIASKGLKRAGKAVARGISKIM